MSKLHLVTQRNQPYGSTRRCCERCGVSIAAGVRYLDDEDSYYKSADRCDAESVEEVVVKARHDAAYNHPAHYGGDTVYEAIKVIEAWGLDFCLGNTVKYISRAGKKDPTKELEDLRKAEWYLKRRIAQLEGK